MLLLAYTGTLHVVVSPSLKLGKKLSRKRRNDTSSEKRMGDAVRQLNKWFIVRNMQQ